MTRTARRALAIIQECVAIERVIVLPHFVKRLDQRGLFWPDVRAVIEAPREVQESGRDEWNRARWILSGEAADAMEIGIVCVLDRDERGDVTVFITVYWQE